MKKWILALIISLTTLSVQADLYTVSGIPAEAEAESAVAAKDIAIGEAIQSAFPILLNKIVLGGDLSAITPMPEQIFSFVESVSVSNEKNTSTKYVGDFYIRFKSKDVQSYLTDLKIPFLTKEPPKMVVIPIFNQNGITTVFDETNPLFSVLKSDTSDIGIYTLTIPAGDETDTALISIAQTDETNYSALNELMRRYDAPAALKIQVDKNGSVYTIKTKVYPENMAGGNDVMFAVSSNSRNLPAVMRQIIEKTFVYMERKYKAYQSYRGLTQGSIYAVFEIQSLAEWIQIEKQLKSLSFLDTVETKAMHKNKVYVQLSFSDKTDAMLEKLAQAGFSLTTNGNLYVWQRTPSAL